MPRPIAFQETLLDAAAGAVAGALATYVMDRSIGMFLDATGDAGDTELTPEELRQGSARSKANVHENLEAEPATMTLTGRLSRVLLERPATRRQRELGGYVFHYAYGAAAGALYSALARRWPAVTRGAGVPYGTAVWLAADEGMITVLRLGRPPGQTPLRAHVASLFAHWAFGAALHLFRKVLPR